jgi:hypothetical protein
MADMQPTTFDTPTLPETDMRRHRRHLCLDHGVLRLSVHPEFRGRRAMLVDISAGGIGFLMQDPLEAGTKLVFELRSPADGAAMTRMARVRHSRPHAVPEGAPWLPVPSAFSKIFRGLLGFSSPASSTAWLVGCEFDAPLSDADIAQFLDLLAATPPEPVA